MTILCLTNTGVCMQLDSRLYNDDEFNMLHERQRTESLAYMHWNEISYKDIDHCTYFAVFFPSQVDRSSTPLYGVSIFT